MTHSRLIKNATRKYKQLDGINIHPNIQDWFVRGTIQFTCPVEEDHQQSESDYGP